MTIKLFGLTPIYLQWSDVLDILIVAFIIYKAIRFFKETRAIQVLKGVALLVFAFFASGWLELRTINFFLKNAIEVGLFAMIVFFQPELKRALERGGRSLSKFFGGMRSAGNENENESLKMIESISFAAERFKSSRTGALIVIERETKIGDIIATGTKLDAQISSRVLENIFYKGAALHDGAVIIRNNRVYAAGCLLPLSQNMAISADLGTRHRAAIGMSENSDAVVVVVSEETGHISLVISGVVRKNISASNLKESLSEIFITENTKKNRLFRFKKGDNNED